MPGQGFETILYLKEGAVAHIVLNRPAVINAYNTQMRDEVWQALEAVRDDPDVRAVVLRGEGQRGFCTGADLTEFGTAPSLAIARRVRFERPVWELWLSIHKPFVCALHGFVLGSGVEMALLCDLRIASDDAVFGMPEVSLGMIPGAGGTQTLPRCIGIPGALELLLTARRMDARGALRLGLVHRVVPPGQLLEEIRATTERLTALDPLVVALAKRAVRQGADLPLGEALALEERLAAVALARRAFS